MSGVKYLGVKNYFGTRNSVVIFLKETDKDSLDQFEDVDLAKFVEIIFYQFPHY